MADDAFVHVLTIVACKGARALQSYAACTMSSCCCILHLALLLLRLKDHLDIRVFVTLFTLEQMNMLQNYIQTMHITVAVASVLAENVVRPCRWQAYLVCWADSNTDSSIPSKCCPMAGLGT